MCGDKSYSDWIVFVENWKQLKTTRYRIALSFVLHLEEHVKTPGPQRNHKEKRDFSV